MLGYGKSSPLSSPHRLQARALAIQATRRPLSLVRLHLDWKQHQHPAAHPASSHCHTSKATTSSHQSALPSVATFTLVLPTYFLRTSPHLLLSLPSSVSPRHHPAFETPAFRPYFFAVATASSTVYSWEASRLRAAAVGQTAIPTSPSQTPAARQILNICRWATPSLTPRKDLHSITFQLPIRPQFPGLKRTLTATIPSPHSLAAILSPSAPSEDTTNSTSRASTPKRTHAEAFSAELAYLHPTSPTQHRASIASVSAPSPGSRAPDDGSAGSTRSLEEKKPQKMVRSSIACVKCRRSKVKCVNTGVNSVCKSCAQNNRECTYPVAGSMPTPKRNEASAGIKIEKGEEGESKKRIRKQAEDSVRRNSTRIVDGPLDSPVLNKKVWDELYAIFKLHFSTEMPFLHPPSFRIRFKQVAYPRDPSIPSSEIQEGKLLLLGVLALTARYHPELEALHGGPLNASEYYAEALQAALAGPISKIFTVQSLEVIQAALMLSLYEWGQTRGLTAWMYVGNAIRLAQSMGLPYEDDTGPQSNSYPKNDTHKNGTESEMITDKEVRRRTWWSCFVMDRMLAAGKCRPTMIDVDKLRIQLPCSDDRFLFKKATRTDVLKANFKREGTEPINNEGVLGWYIRLVEIFGRFSVWSYSGGRRTETQPPWHPSTTFYQIRTDLEEFHHALPPSLTFTPENLSAHIEGPGATAYASLHTLYLLCLIMLHREYFPFIPLACKGPNGPLDEPTFSPSRFPPPPNFWKDSAETVFKAARDIIEIVTTLRDDDALPQSAQIGFAIFQAAFVCLYSSYFEQMDTGRYVHPGTKHRNKRWTDTAAELVRDMVPRLSMMKRYQETLQKTGEFFANASSQYHNHIAGGEKPASYSGGGADQYKSRERDLKEYGGLSDPADRRSRASTDDATASSNGDAMVGVETPRSMGWQTVNMPDADDRLKYEVSLGYGAQSNNYPVQAHQAHLVNNGHPAPLLNSPYGNGATPHYSHTQPPHHATSYPTSVAHHTSQPGMAPPPQQSGIWPIEKQLDWTKHHHQINFSSAFDNFGQATMMVEDDWQGLQPTNYIQAIHNVNGWAPDRVPSPSHSTKRNEAGYVQT
ncbi:Zn2/Cys6 DNA-binding protein [Glarea lozoyensis ATCC 20868]|uniref:Zn2/Cys6 DNA-binding protein n=1 Tax=Glarea lozoyensis (strain ATCC 20868 / MF5171) TaxID=1116229 RepID=S3DPH8_GLAL2|nr:Zn2/Cys6 DNA-binding protein [Glarea lozoyensis ATCC 20868]EPE28343.1 Zn2/Cys6 DNA-binding protein [Glarea lozoyensis ATCC 20868]